MAKLFSLCGYTGANTGGIDCDESVGNPEMFFFGGAKLTVAEQATRATVRAALLNRIQRANGDPEKLYPFPVIYNAADNTEQPQDETAGNGAKRRLRESKKAMTFEMWNVGTTQEGGLAAFSGSQLPGFMLSDSKKLCGKHTPDGLFVGSQVQISFDAAGPGIYTAGSSSKMSVAWTDSRAFSSNLKWYETDFDAEDFNGLLDAKVVRMAAPTGNAHKVGLHVKTTQINSDMNIYIKYADVLADVDVWRGYTNAGAVVAPTTVTADPTLALNGQVGGWIVTFSVPVSKIDLVTPDILAQNDVTGIEGVALAV